MSQSPRGADLAPLISAPVISRPGSGQEFPTAEGCHILENWNRPDDPTLSVARARVAPGVTTRWHRLVGISERYLVIAGEGLAEVDGMEPAVLRTGDLLFIPPGRAQRIRTLSPTDLIFYAICTPRFQPSAYQDLGDSETPDDPQLDSDRSPDSA